MSILIGINKSITANNYSRIIFSIIFGSLFSFSSQLVFSQATQETDGEKYRTKIPQIAGGIREVEYQRDKNGLIIALPIEDGKLVDGSDAPSNPLRAKIAQRKIIAQYDPINIAKAGKEDIASKANKDIGEMTTLAEQGRLDKTGLYKGISATYTVRLFLGNEATEKNINSFKSILNGFEKYGRTILKMSADEIEQMKKNAKEAAQNKLDTFGLSVGK